ncbi:MAG: hypothetical protein ACTSVC_11845, partial [Promethearchaeota archaeon]
MVESLEENLKNNNKSDKRPKKYIERTIIKLGSSFAVTFPAYFLESFKNEMGNIKGISVHAYKIDDQTILLKKYRAESEKYVLEIDMNKFPINLLENILISAKKLNIHQLDIIYPDDLYERCLEIMNKLNLTPFHSQNKMTLDLSRKIDSNFKFSEQVRSMVKNFSKIIQLTLDPNHKSPKSIEIFLTSINSNFNEALRVLIYHLNNYYLFEKEKNLEVGSTRIINMLGNRVLISKIQDIANQTSNLYWYKETPEFKKYKQIIEKFPQLLDKEIEFFLDESEGSEITLLNSLYCQINDVKNILTQILEKHKDSEKNVNEEIIIRIINICLKALNEIFE